MEFLVTECVKVNWYYSPIEITIEINKERGKNKLPLCFEDNVSNAIDYLKSGHRFLNIEDSVGSCFCMNEKKQKLIFSIQPENKELIIHQVQGLFDFIISELGKGNIVEQKDINDMAHLLAQYYEKNLFVEKLENHLPEKEKASIKKPKI